MKLLDRLVLKDLLPMFGVGIGMFSVLWFCGGPILTAARFLSQGFGFLIVLHYLLLNIPMILGLTFPMAMLFSVLIGYGRLSSESEAVAAFAAGIPFLRVAAPAAVLGLVASGIGFYITDHMATRANSQMKEIEQDYFKQGQDTTKPIDPPAFRDKNNKLLAIVHIENGIDVRTGMLRGVTITTYGPTGAPTSIVYAPYAKWDGDWRRWKLYNVDVDYLGTMTHWHTPTSLNTAPIDETPSMLAFLERDPDTLSFSDLKRQIAAIKAGGSRSNHLDQVRGDELAMWRIVAVPLASLVFAVVGAPLGLRPQRTARFTGWGLAILIIFFYYVLYTVTGSMASGGTITPIAAAFLPDIVGFTVGAGLVARAAN